MPPHKESTNFCSLEISFCNWFSKMLLMMSTFDVISLPVEQSAFWSSWSIFFLYCCRTVMLLCLQVNLNSKWTWWKRVILESDLYRYGCVTRSLCWSCGSTLRWSSNSCLLWLESFALCIWQSVCWSSSMISFSSFSCFPTIRGTRGLWV